MKIIVTGSLGHISKPLAEELMKKGHSVTIVSSKPEKQKDIEALGAKAAIGSVEDVDFLTKTFTGEDAAYCMIPPNPGNFSNPDFDFVKHTQNIANNYKQAIQKSGVKRMVFLSSIGAHMAKGNGILAFYYIVEKMLSELPSGTAITFMRPVGFYYNLFAFMDTIKTQGVIASNYGGDVKKPWVSPIDIAAAVAEEIVASQPPSRKIRYVASDEISCNEVATVLGSAIGKPDLKWVVITDEQLLNGMVSSGMNPKIAAGFVEMNAITRTGVIYEDYYRHQPVLGKVKMSDFAKEFAGVYQGK